MDWTGDAVSVPEIWMRAGLVTARGRSAHNAGRLGRRVWPDGSGAASMVPRARGGIERKPAWPGHGQGNNVGYRRTHSQSGERARRYTEDAGPDRLAGCVEGDFMKMDFADDSFDSACTVNRSAFSSREALRNPRALSDWLVRR